MKKYLSFFIVLFILFINKEGLVSQGLYDTPLPLEVRNAFQKGTRSVSGRPGSNYWQNKASYSIRATLDHRKSKLKATSRVSYYNFSPDTLNQIVIRLYPDIFKTGNARQINFNSEAVNNGMVISTFSLNGSPVDLDDKNTVYRTATNLVVKLQEGFLPGDSVVMNFSWEYEVPKMSTLRCGRYGDNLYFIAYWYPQVAVYDDIDGWDMVDYLGMVEFYNDFNDYKVDITTDEGYLIWATGELTNLEEIYTDQVIGGYLKANESDTPFMIFTTADCRDGRVLRKKGKTTWHFEAFGVPDFSFGATDAANWEGSAVAVEGKPDGRKVFVDAVYGDNPRIFDQVAEQARRSVEYMSNELPGYPFPYAHMTTFDNGLNGGGMETPMMANNGDPSNLPSASATIFHEIAHSYFPFFMGINERKYAWMDEGWAAFLPGGFMEEYFPDYRYFQRRCESFERVNGKGIEMRLMDYSYYSGNYLAYRSQAYNRPSMAYYFLQEVLGDTLFKGFLQTFIKLWHGKHPIPYDFFNLLNEYTGTDMGWFVTPWFFTRAYADLGIKKVTMDNQIVVSNIGGLPLPIVLSCHYTDGTIEIYRQKAGIWSSGERAVVVQANGDKRIDQVILGTDLIPDINDSNNIIKPDYR